MNSEAVAGYFQSPYLGIVLALSFLLVLLELKLRRRWTWASLFRLLWLLGLGFLVADWKTVGSKEWSQPELLRVFWDRSDSVQKVDSRKGNLDLFLKELQEWATSSKQPIEISSFSDSLRLEAIDKKSDPPSKGELTYLSPVVKALQEHEGNALVLSDGRFFDDVRFQKSVQGIQLGDDQERDIWLDGLPPLYTAFLKNRVKLGFQIHQLGFSSEEVMVSLWRGKEKLEERKIKLTKNENEVEFSYFPEKMGQELFMVRVEPVEGELSSLNNSWPFQVRTVRDKIRVLHIGGKPSLDLKTWRLFLTRQPDVDLVSFYILRSVDDDPEAKNSELSLIPFPYDELFTTELSKFDVVVLQNFDFTLYFQPFYLANLARFVREGGALLVMGGDQSFHRYRGSPLEPLFPFRFEGDGNFQSKAQKVRIKKPHPLLKGLELSFQAVPWETYHRISSLPEAEDLLVFQSGVPFISLRQVEKGRVLSINSDESWKLHRYPNAEPASFSRFARRAFQYLTFDPELEPQKIQSDLWRVGTDVKLSLTSGQMSWWKISSLMDSFKMESKNLSKDLRLKVPAPGVYFVESVEGEAYFQTEEQPWRGEWKNLLSSTEALEKSNIRTYAFADRQSVFDQRLSGRQLISADVSSWSQSSTKAAWAFIFLILFCMGMDFYLRKKMNWDG